MLTVGQTVYAKDFLTENYRKLLKWDKLAIPNTRNATNSVKALSAFKSVDIKVTKYSTEKRS